MSGHQVGIRTPAAIDVTLTLGYPASANIELVDFPNGQIHDINYAGAPGVLFANAPNASRLYDNTNGDLWIKTKDVGSGIDGVWTQASP
jgi:hypothetical protein